MNIKICPAERIHVKGIYHLVEELAVYEKARHEMTMTLDQYDTAFEEGQFESIVALLDDKVIGTCIYYDTFSTWKGKMLYLEDFVVNEKFRKAGVGQLLYNELLKIGRRKEAALVKWQVLDWNDPAIKFYEKNNATIEKEWWNCKVIYSRIDTDQ